jgi:hypothetical protein
MICSSSPVPSVVTTRPCVSPRVNSAEPWVRGSTEVSGTIGRTSSSARPSIRLAVFDHVAAQHLGFQLLQRRAEVRVFQLLFAQRRLDRLLAAATAF